MQNLGLSKISIFTIIYVGTISGEKKLAIAGEAVSLSESSM